MRVRLHNAAIDELAAARDWYERARPGPGASFAAEVERVVAAIDEAPHCFPVHQEEIRRASLRRFPFSIYFENVGSIRYIWAVFHHRRDRSPIAHRRTS